MDHDFTSEHFDLLATWDGVARRTDDPGQDRAYAILVDSYEATARWARAVQERLFPNGLVRKLSKPTDQGQKFKPYTWARIYPRRDAPTGLAYTVGIDAVGEFCVKIDTVNQGGAPRRRYEELSRHDNHLSPFAAIVPATTGLAMSFEQLVTWSIDSIATFEPGYDAIAAKVGLVSRALTLVTDPHVSRAAFARWLDALREDEEGEGAVHAISGHTVWFTAREGAGGAEVRLGLDPTGQEWGVEINAPPVPGDHNRLSAIAIDESGGLHLLRQGWLRGRRPAPDIREQEFALSTGLSPVDVGATGKSTLRRWFLVASISDAPERIRRTTADFVELCWAARTPISNDLGGGKHTGIDDAGQVAGGEELAGNYWIPARPAVNAKLVEKLHALVWQALAKAFGRRVSYRKWRRTGGYSIDMEVAPVGGVALLVEIKTGCSASDIHTGVGQLQLYRQLFPSLRGHRAVLLVDSEPPAAMRRAITALGIEVHRYYWSGEDGRVVELSPELLFLCGIEPTEA